jgi:hypothetical protein
MLRARRPGFHSRQQKKILLFLTASTSTLAVTQPLYNGYWGTPSPGVKRPESEPDHSHLSSIYVKNYETIPPLPHTSSRRNAQLIRHRDDEYSLCHSRNYQNFIKPKVYYHDHKISQLIPVLGQMNPDHIFHPTCLRFILILFSHLCPGFT